jgi:uncharacterized membrane protein YphA (DoxX/SURF4 family)
MLAHVKWFTPEREPLDWSLLGSPGVLLGLGIAAVAGVVLWWVSRRVDEERWVGSLARRLRPYLPLLLSVHLGIALIANAAEGFYLAPGLTLPSGSTGTFLALLQVAVALLIISGLFTRVAAALLVLSGPIGMLEYGFLPILERVELLGIALYLAVVGRRRWSLDALRHRDAEPFGLNPAAVAMLRVLAGLAMMVGALTEKLLAPDVSLAFLERYAHFNVLAGLGVTDGGFVAIAGAIELALGLILLSGVATRLAVLAAVVPFNVTLLFLGWRELIGHLPIYGIFLVLLVEGAGRLRDAPGLSSGTAGSSTSSGSRS